MRHSISSTSMRNVRPLSLCLPEEKSTLSVYCSTGDSGFHWMWPIHWQFCLLINISTFIWPIHWRSSSCEQLFWTRVHRWHTSSRSLLRLGAFKWQGRLLSICCSHVTIQSEHFFIGIPFHVEHSRYIPRWPCWRPSLNWWRTSEAKIWIPHITLEWSERYKYGRYKRIQNRNQPVLFRLNFRGERVAFEDDLS